MDAEQLIPESVKLPQPLALSVRTEHTGQHHLITVIHQARLVTQIILGKELVPELLLDSYVLLPRDVYLTDHVLLLLQLVDKQPRV